MSNFEHDTTLIVGAATGSRADWSAGARREVAPGAVVLVPGVIAFEWLCQLCGAVGQGFMPEEHASGSCSPRTDFRMVPEVAREAQNTVTAILHGATHFMDGGGI